MTAANNELLKKIYKQKTLLIFLLPSFFALLIFNYVPLFGNIMAFQDYDILKGFSGSNFVGIKHFAEFLAQPDFYNALKNTLGINLLALLVGFPLTIVLAILLNELAFVRIKKVIQTITYMPHFVSWVVMAGLLYRMLDSESGIINILRESLGQEKIAFLREPGYFWGILIFAAILKEVGWNMIIYFSALTGIDQSLYEAAFADGAGRLRRIWHITLPGLMPTVSVLFILTVGSIISVSGGGGGTMLPNFDAVYNVRNAMVWEKADVLDIYALEAGIRQGYYSYAAAIGLAQSMVALLLVFTANRFAAKINGSNLV